MSFTDEHLVGHSDRVRRVFTLAGLELGNGKARRAELRLPCPFHADGDSHSLDVNIGKAAYLCRSPKCGVGGDAVDFYARRLNLTPEQAIAELRQKLDLPTRYEIRDAAGALKATHLFTGRDENGKKRMPWEPKGVKPATLPLYRSERLAQSPDDPVIVTEGEKAADALLDREVVAVGTVTGAGGTPDAAALEVLRGRDVTLWPDFDESGKKHMERIGAALQGVAASVAVFEWGEQKGDDAADYFSRGGDVERLSIMLLENAKPLASPATSPPFATLAKIAAMYGGTVKGASSLPTISGREILSTDYPEPRWIVPRLVIEGLVILFGRPKIGKSWLALALAIAAVCGGPFLGFYRAIQTGVLYLALEDSPRRIKKRLLALGNTTIPEGLDFLFSHPRLDAGGAEALDAWLGEHPDVHLVIIDTLNRVRSARPKNVDPYQHDAQEIGKLQAIAMRRGVSLVIVHHDRKAEAEDWLDRLSGTLGVAGTADALMFLERDRGSTDGRLRVTGRDLDTEIDRALEFKGGLWHVIADGALSDLSPERRLIVDACPESGEGFSPTQIKLKAGLSVNTVKAALPALVRAGFLRQPRTGRYNRNSKVDE